jgi:hypothetical protein
VTETAMSRAGERDSGPGVRESLRPAPTAKLSTAASAFFTTWSQQPSICTVTPSVVCVNRKDGGSPCALYSGWNGSICSISEESDWAFRSRTETCRGEVGHASPKPGSAKWNSNSSCGSYKAVEPTNVTESSWE